MINRMCSDDLVPLYMITRVYFGFVHENYTENSHLIYLTTDAKNTKMIDGRKLSNTVQ